MADDILDECPNCKKRGMPWVIKDSVATARMCQCCSFVQPINNDMRAKSQKQIRPNEK